MSKHFISNKNNHFFASLSPIDESKLVDCKTFDSLDSLLAHVATVATIDEFTADDIRGSEILIKEEEGRWFCSTHYGAFIPIEDMEDEDDEPEDIYQWLSEFEC